VYKKSPMSITLGKGRPAVRTCGYMRMVMIFYDTTTALIAYVYVHIRTVRAVIHIHT
jgi:hypothetical protein